MASTRSKLENKLRALAKILRRNDEPGGAAGVLAEMVFKRLRSVRLSLELRHLHGPRETPAAPVVLCSLRDGAEYLPHFLAHHRRLGAAHFVFLDNGSRDATESILRAQSDVTMLRSRLPYREYKHAFKRHLIRRFGRDRWSLLLDIDECFDFPGSARVGLPGFCRYLEARGFNAVVAHMLDLFSPGPILEAPAAPDGDLSRVHRHYDLGGLKGDPHAFAFGGTNVISDPGIECLSCGINLTAFGNDLLLTKHPLLRWSPPMELPKYAHDISYARIADVSAVLLHYKFTRDFAATLARAVREGGYYKGSARYVRMEELLREDPAFSLHGPGARRLEDVEELVTAGFLRASPEYRAWLAAQPGG